jgi:hypothetical protein
VVAAVLLVISVGWQRHRCRKAHDPFGVGLLSDAWLAEHRRETDSGSMELTRQVRQMAQQGMEEESAEFRKRGEIYVKR